MKQLEERAKLSPPPHHADFPSRLDRCLRVLKRNGFQTAIRERTIAPLARNLLKAQDALGKELPSQARELAALGSLANPIVNFNVEALTSRALAEPGGPWKPLPFRPPALDQLSLPRSDLGSHDGKRFQRHVYHPHGVIDLTGLCALAGSDYQAMQGTLALELAAHAAFGLNLAIVGMSLNDDYLREQIGRFRSQIRDIIFFTDKQPESAIGEWAWRTSVQVITASWDEFWSSVRSEFPPPDEIGLRECWGSMLLAAFRSRGIPVRDIAQELRRLGAPPDKLAPWYQVAALQGESGSTSPDATTRELPTAVRDFLVQTLKMTAPGKPGH